MTQPQPIKLEDLTMEQLKALAYDQMVQMQMFQNNINVIQAEIARRNQTQAGSLPARNAPAANEKKK